MTDHNCGKRPAHRADVTLPVRDPIEGLKRGVIGVPLERSPLCADLIEVVMQAKLDARSRRRLARLARPGDWRAREQWKLRRFGARRRQRDVAGNVGGRAGAGALERSLVRPNHYIACGHRLLARQPGFQNLLVRARAMVRKPERGSKLLCAHGRNHF